MTDPIHMKELGQKEAVEAAMLKFTEKINYKFDRKCDIPSFYNDNKLVLMVRDPWTVFAFWEVNRDVENNVRERIKNSGAAPLKSMLRVYEVMEREGGSETRIFSDFELKDWADNWYVHTGGDGKSWMADIGILCNNGEFFCLARSNVVSTPRYGMSEIYDEEWMCTEELYYKMFAAAGGFDIGKSSLELKETIHRFLREWISSGGVSSGMFGSYDLFRGKK
ncbi:MAG: DUF4912 domain-containing protein [Candidatus Omnitrophota bacterium]